ncbi:unnamed protein product [Prunus armeniaca]
MDNSQLTLTKPQQAPISSIPGIQVCKSCAGAVLHAQHLTFLEFHTSLKIFSFQRHSLATDERLNALEEEVRLLWAASRKYNFDLHLLEFKAQDAEDRLGCLSGSKGNALMYSIHLWSVAMTV